MLKLLVSLILMLQASIFVYFTTGNQHWTLVVSAWILVATFLSTNIYLLIKVYKEIFKINK